MSFDTLCVSLLHGQEAHYIATAVGPPERASEGGYGSSQATRPRTCREDVSILASGYCGTVCMRLRSNLTRGHGEPFYGCHVMDVAFVLA